MGDDDAAVSVSSISTGALSLDLAPGVGGLPVRGRIVEIFGPESSGKTTMVYHVLAEAQRRGGDLRLHRRGARDGPRLRAPDRRGRRRAARLQPDHGEQAFEIADLLIRSGAIDVVAIDSVAAPTPKTELEGAMGTRPSVSRRE